MSLSSSVNGSTSFGCHYEGINPNSVVVTARRMKACKSPLYIAPKYSFAVPYNQRLIASNVVYARRRRLYANGKDSMEQAVRVHAKLNEQVQALISNPPATYAPVYSGDGQERAASMLIVRGYTDAQFRLIRKAMIGSGNEHPYIPGILDDYYGGIAPISMETATSVQALLDLNVASQMVKQRLLASGVVDDNSVECTCCENRRLPVVEETLPSPIVGGDAAASTTTRKRTAAAAVADLHDETYITDFISERCVGGCERYVNIKPLRSEQLEYIRRLNKLIRSVEYGSVGVMICEGCAGTGKTAVNTYARTHFVGNGPLVVIAFKHKILQDAADEIIGQDFIYNSVDDAVARQNSGRPKGCLNPLFLTMASYSIQFTRNRNMATGEDFDITTTPLPIYAEKAYNRYTFSNGNRLFNQHRLIRDKQTTYIWFVDEFSMISERDRAAIMLSGAKAARVAGARLIIVFIGDSLQLKTVNDAFRTIEPSELILRANQLTAIIKRRGPDSPGYIESIITNEPTDYKTVESSFMDNRAIKRRPKKRDDLTSFLFDDDDDDIDDHSSDEDENSVQSIERVYACNNLRLMARWLFGKHCDHFIMSKCVRYKDPILYDGGNEGVDINTTTTAASYPSLVTFVSSYAASSNDRRRCVVDGFIDDIARTLNIPIYRRPRYDMMSTINSDTMEPHQSPSQQINIDCTKLFEQLKTFYVTKFRQNTGHHNQISEGSNEGDTYNQWCIQPDLSYVPSDFYVLNKRNVDCWKIWEAIFYHLFRFLFTRLPSVSKDPRELTKVSLYRFINVYDHETWASGGTSSIIRNFLVVGMVYRVCVPWHKIRLGTLVVLEEIHYVKGTIATTTPGQKPMTTNRILSVLVRILNTGERHAMLPIPFQDVRVDKGSNTIGFPLYPQCVDNIFQIQGDTIDGPVYVNADGATTEEMYVVLTRMKDIKHLKAIINY